MVWRDIVAIQLVVSISDKMSYCRVSQSQTHEICVEKCLITLEFDKHLSSTAAKTHIKFEIRKNVQCVDLLDTETVFRVPFS